MQEFERNNEEFETIDLRDIIDVLLHWKWMIILLTITCIVTAGILSFFVLPPVYEAKTILLVTQGDTKQRVRYNTDDLESFVGSLSRLPEMTINTYVEQVKNPNILARTIETLRLDELGYTPAGLGNLIDVKALKDTNLIEIKVENTDCVLAPKIANKLADHMLEFISESNQEQMSKSVIFLQEQNDTVQAQLEDLNIELEKLESQPRNVDYLEHDKESKTKDLMELRSQYMQAQIEYQQLLVGQTQIESSLNDIPQTIQTIDKDNPTIKRTETNPEYVRMLAELENRKASVAEKKAQLEGIAGYTSKLEKELGILQGELTEKKANLTRLQKQIAELENTYTLLSEKITQTQITKSINLGETNLQVISKAMVPVKPVKPKKTLNVAIAAVLGVMISIGLAFVMEFFDNTVRTQEDVERKLGLPVLGTIPQYSSKNIKKEVKLHDQKIASTNNYTS